jgi:hypothetical protein
VSAYGNERDMTPALLEHVSTVFASGLNNNTPQRIVLGLAQGILFKFLYSLWRAYTLSTSSS